MGVGVNGGRRGGRGLPSRRLQSGPAVELRPRAPPPPPPNPPPPARHVLDLPRVPVVARPPDDGDSRLLLLNKDAASVRAAAGPDAAAALDAAGAVDEEYVLERGYENLTADEVLKVRTEVGWTEVGWSRC